MTQRHGQSPHGTAVFKPCPCCHQYPPEDDMPYQSGTKWLVVTGVCDTEAEGLTPEIAVAKWNMGVYSKLGSGVVQEKVMAEIARLL